MSQRGHRIGIVGTFDVANFGDLLFPLLAEAALGERLGQIELRSYSYRRMKAPPWPYDVRSLNDLVDDIDELDLLLVGGGHLLRTDPHVAPNYMPTAAGLHHPTAYWFLPTVLAAAGGVPVAWNALGATVGLSSQARHLLALGARAAAYISVRDQYSADELVAASSLCAPTIVPDTAFAIADLASPDRTAVNDLLTSHGITGPYAVIHSAREFRPHLPWLRDFAASLLDRGITPVEVTIGPVFGERPDLLRSLPGVASIETFPAPLVLAALLGGAEAVLTQSLHASIVALALGAPVYRLAAVSAEKHELLQPIPRVYYLDRPSVDADIGHRPPSAQIEETRAQISAHWDAIAALTRRGRRPIDSKIISEVIGLRTESLLAATDSASGDHSSAGARRERELLLQAEALAQLRREVKALRAQLRELSQIEGRWQEEQATLAAEQAEHQQTRQELAELEERLTILEAARDNAMSQRDGLTDELERLQASRSWRYTANLRRVARRLR